MEKNTDDYDKRDRIIVSKFLKNLGKLRKTNNESVDEGGHFAAVWMRPEAHS